MTKTIEEIVCTYKKESNPNKKVKLLAICHLLENGKTITEVSKILFKTYNTIKSWWQAFRKDGIRGLEIKKYPVVCQRSKTKHFWNLWGQRQRKNNTLFLKILCMI